MIDYAITLASKKIEELPDPDYTLMNTENTKTNETKSNNMDFINLLK
jgi:hypothetical protein